MNTSRYIWVVAIVAIILIASVLYFVPRAIGPRTRPSLSPTASPQTQNPPSEVASVRMTVQGPVVSNEQYRAATLSISTESRTLTIFATYTSQVLVVQNLPNNQEAFDQFYEALRTAGYLRVGRGKSDSSVGSTCPIGKRFTYETLGASSDAISSLWATTCSTPEQSFGGNVGLVNQLFRAQFPELNQIPQFQPLQF